MQIIFGLIADMGDGTSCIIWLRNEAIVDRLLEEEQFYQNDSAMIFEFPDDLDLEKCGFEFDDEHYQDRLDNTNQEDDDG